MTMIEDQMDQLYEQVEHFHTMFEHQQLHD
jgi:hypothetical protein